MRKINVPLIIGALIIALLLAIILFPGFFTAKSPYNIQHLIFNRDNGGLEVDMAPFPPSSQFILGSDDMGRDIFSLIIYGTGLTILLGVLIALGRFLIAVPMALSAGFGNKMSKSAIKQFNILFSAIPALLISVIILKLDYLTGLDKSASILAFVVVLSAVGWPKLGSLLMERVDSINSQQFIRSEVAMGKSRFKIAVENVFPHLAPEMVVLFFMEIARALSTVMQLGIFSVFVGFLRIIKDTEGTVTFYDISFEPEWAGMMSTSKNLLSSAPWAVIFPAIAFFISVLGFNLFGEGLRNVLQRSDSLFIPRIRKLLSFDIKYIWSSFSKKGRITVITSTLLITLFIVLTVVFTGNSKPLEIPKSYYPSHESVVIGTDEAYETALNIAVKMEEIGLKPLKSDSYIHTYEIPTMSLINNQSLSLNSKEYLPEVDFAVLDSQNGSFSGRVYDLTKEDLFSLEDFSHINDHFVMIDKAYYNDAAIAYFIQRLETGANVKGVILVARAYESLKDIYAGRNGGALRVVVTREVAEDIKSNLDAEINVMLDAKTLGTTGCNVIGILEGMDELLNEEAILIGLPYNYTTEGEKEVTAFGMKLMEEICTAKQNRRSLIFIFADGTDKSMLNGLNALSDNYIFSPNKTKLFMNLLNMNDAQFDTLTFSALQSPFTRQYAWSMGRQLGQNLEKGDIDFIEAESIFFGDQYYFTQESTYNKMFMTNGIATIILATENEGTKSSLEELGRILVDTINENNY